MSNPTRNCNPPVWDAIYSATFSALYSKYIKENKRTPIKEQLEQITSFAIEAADDGVNELLNRTSHND